MFCPNCSQERMSVETNFCSKCGYLLTGTAELLQLGGVSPLRERSSSMRPSARSKGIKQGLFIFLLTFLIVPIIAIITIANDAEPYAIVISSILLFVGGLLRMAYALMFESPVANDHGERDDYMAASMQMLKQTPANGGLPPQRSMPADTPFRAATGTWRDTRDLEPASVTDGTTKLLDSDEL